MQIMVITNIIENEEFVFRTEESLIGEAISHGCIRMLNEDVEDLYTYVELGTTVIVKR